MVLRPALDFIYDELQHATYEFRAGVPLQNIRRSCEREFHGNARMLSSGAQGPRHDYRRRENMLPRTKIVLMTLCGVSPGPFTNLGFDAHLLGIGSSTRSATLTTSFFLPPIRLHCVVRS